MQMGASIMAASQRAKSMAMGASNGPTIANTEAITSQISSRAMESLSGLTAANISASGLMAGNTVRVSILHRMAREGKVNGVKAN